MLNFKRSSLNQKLTIMSLVPAATASLLMLIAFAVTSAVEHRISEATQLARLAGVLGANSADALQLRDRALAQRTLATLQASSGIAQAVLYDRQGKPFAVYRAGQAASADIAPHADTQALTASLSGPAGSRGKGRDHQGIRVPQRGTAREAAGTRVPDGMRVSAAKTAADTVVDTVVDAVMDAAAGMLADTATLASIEPAALDAANVQGRQFWSSTMRLYRPLAQDSGQIGALMIESSLSAMWLALMRSLGIFCAATAGALLLALLPAWRLRRSIAAPVRQLIQAAKAVSISQDWSLRVAHQRSDELGVLIDSFNTMLAQIEERGAALTHHSDALEQQVGMRTAQLEKAKNAAEAASHAKSAFLATMSHEIRTPMNGVLGMTEMLLGTQLSDTQRDFTRLVKRSGEHLLVIINDILDFSKIEAGKLSVEYINFNLWDLLDDIHTVYTPQARAKQLGLDFDIANNIPVAICGDPNRLRQIIANLLGNAIKFTDSGRILATVRLASEDAQTVALRFEVHDTGIGIDSAARSRIFEAFSQADDSTTRKYGGTGLGLAISRQLVELMGGKIGVDNGRIQGSVFWFIVSFDKRGVEPGLMPQAASPKVSGKRSAAQSGLNGLRVLVVDEQSASRGVLERQLGLWQVAATCATSALDGIERLRAAAAVQQPFDAAIIDMELARTSGLALAAAIKAEPAIRATRLLLLSPDRMAADLVQRRAAGVAYQLTKPTRSADLYACLATRPRATAAQGVSSSVQASSARATAVEEIEADASAAQIDADEARSPFPARSSAARPMRAGARVLLAEDNPVNVEVAKAMLDSLGLQVVCASHGAEALAALRQQTFDMVLMDCQMPVMDGFAATAAIRRMEREVGARGRVGTARHIPIIAITANALQGDREACLAAGMDDYLSKPFSQQQLHAVVGAWIALPTLAAQDAGEYEIPARRTAPTALLRPAASAPAFMSAHAPAQAHAPAPVLTPAPAPASVPVRRAQSAINERALDAIRALSSDRGSALVQKVVGAWVDDTPQCLSALRHAIAARDALEVRKLAHSLKSSSANVGADYFARLSRQLEQLGREGSTEGASAILHDMEHEFHAVRHSLSAMLEKET